jgi:hypothetical protein
MPREIVYVGTDDSTLELPEPVDDEKSAGFKAVSHLTDLDALHGRYDPPFTHLQVVCVVSKPIRDWWTPIVFVPYRAVRWLICLPVEKQGRRYVPVTYTIPPDGDDVFYCFTDSTSHRKILRAVPHLDGLKFLSPFQVLKPAVVRAKSWRWDKRQNTVFIHPQDVIETEIIRYSRLRVFYI